MYAAISFLDVYYKDFEFIEDEIMRRIQLDEAKKFILNYFEINNLFNNSNESSPQPPEQTFSSSSSGSSSCETQDSQSSRVTPSLNQTQAELRNASLEETDEELRNNTTDSNEKTPTSIYRRKSHKTLLFFFKFIALGKKILQRLIVTFEHLKQKSKISNFFHLTLQMRIKMKVVIYIILYFFFN